MNSNAFHFASAALVTLFGTVAAFDWSSIVSAHTAAEIVVGLGVAKTFFSLSGGTSANGAS